MERLPDRYSQQLAQTSLSWGGRLYQTTTRPRGRRPLRVNSLEMAVHPCKCFVLLMVSMHLITIFLCLMLSAFSFFRSSLFWLCVDVIHHIIVEALPNLRFVILP